MSSFNGVPLPSNYQPSPHTVIVGRGKLPKQNLGNKRLTILSKTFMDKYRHGDKQIKSQIVKDIICMIRGANGPDGKGSFVKFDKNTGTWFDLDNGVAREKLGYVFRDLLSDQYKSSSKSKVAQRQQERKTRRRISDASSTSSSSDSSLFSISSSSSLMVPKGNSSPVCQMIVSSSPPVSNIGVSNEHEKDILLESTNFLDDFHDVQQTVDIVPFSLVESCYEEQFDSELLLRLPMILQ